jgi:hypothetical protein
MPDRQVDIYINMKEKLRQPKSYMNPYLAGILLGFVLLASFYLTGRGLGASGATRSVVIGAVTTVTPEHAENSGYFSKYLGDNQMKTWLVLEIAGVIIGGFLSGAWAGRLKIRVEHSPGISKRKSGFGSQLGRGCTSGAALTGMSVMSLAGFVTMMAIFGTAFALAYFFRKNWI